MNKKIFEALYGSKLMITGATGMIGQNLVNYILKMDRQDNTDITIIAHGRSEEKMQRVYGNLMRNPRFQTIVCDISQLTYTQDVDYIVHTASVTGGSKQHLDYPLITLSTAIDGTRRVLDLALEKKCKGVIFLSSLEVYGFTGNLQTDIKETDGGYIDTMNPRSSYKEGKRLSECLFAAYARQFGLRAIVARLTSSFGAGASLSDNRVFAQFARSILAGKDIVLNSTGETVRNYCDALDVASALLTLLAVGESGEAYNVANRNAEISIKGLADSFVELYPFSGSKVVFDLSKDARKLGYNPVMRSVLDASKLERLGWEPEFGIQDMIGHLIESMKSEYNHV